MTTRQARQPPRGDRAVGVTTSRAANGWTETVRAMARTHLASGTTHLGEREARTLLEKVVAFAPARPARNALEAAAAALELKAPVVLKVLAPGVLHKTELGLVRPGLRDAREIENAAIELAARARDAGLDDFELSVQTQLSGLEFALGIRRSELGTVCMIAAGGILIEVLDDSALAMAPLTLQQADRVIQRLRSAPVLDGYRGWPRLDRQALVAMLSDISVLAGAVPEISELDLNPVFVDASGVVAADARCVLAPFRPEPEDTRSGASAVRRIFEPRRIAVVGASQDVRKPGSLLLRYLRKHEYAGELVAVNPRDLKLDGIRTYPSVAAIEGSVDLACLAVPARHVRGVVEECVQAGIPAGIIYTAGYAESGSDGASAQRDLVEVAGERFRFVGPNSIGVASPPHRLFASFGMALEGELPRPGPIALVSQSGAIASALVSRSIEFGAGVSYWISTGNEADLGLADYLEYLADDVHTRVVYLFLEVVRRPAAFARACRRVRAAGKALIAVKTGRSEAGRAAAASHTGAMTGSDRTYDAFLDACGVLRVPDLPGLFSAAQGVLLAGTARGRRVGIISMSGGACSLLADACQEAGLEVPRLPPETERALSRLLPRFGGTRNPVDVTAEGIGRPELVSDALELLRTSGAVDLVLIQLSTNADPAAEAIAGDLALASHRIDVPFLVGRLGAASLAPKALRLYRDAGMHVFVWPEQLVQAGRAACWHGTVAE